MGKLLCNCRLGCGCPDWTGVNNGGLSGMVENHRNQRETYFY
jgi:hypothetical protein